MLDFIGSHCVNVYLIVNEINLIVAFSWSSRRYLATPGHSIPRQSMFKANVEVRNVFTSTP